MGGGGPGGDGGVRGGEVSGSLGALKDCKAWSSRWIICAGTAGTKGWAWMRERKIEGGGTEAFSDEAWQGGGDACGGV